ncbi:hypothetical protein Leryth_027139 [Lithospermum erythrorhizon]|nr:hypothetical protein Leryth_027139 [Lithospermum erythrorhizon]
MKDWRIKDDVKRGATRGLRGVTHLVLLTPKHA